MRMKKDKLELIEELRKIPPLVDQTIRALGDIPDHELGALYTFTGQGRARVDLPRQKDLVAQYLKMIATQGSWRRVREEPKGINGDLYYYYRHTNLPINLTICFNIDHEEATCRRVQVGEETITSPIYEIICDEEEDNGPEEK